MSHKKSLAYTVVVGTGDLAHQALGLLRSIHEVDSNPEIYPLVVPEEIPDIPDRVIKELQELGTIIKGQNVVSNYPHSRKITALIKAHERTTHEAVLMLDADTFLWNPIKVYERVDAEVYAKPADIGTMYWSREESFSCWKELYHQHDLEFPGTCYRATVDNEEIPPFWNAGVVISKSPPFAREWKKVTKNVFKNIQKDTQFADQVALGILSEKYHTYSLSEECNFPVPHQPVPNGTTILHHHGYDHLTEVENDRLEEYIHHIGLLPPE